MLPLFLVPSHLALECPVGLDDTLLVYVSFSFECKRGTSRSHCTMLGGHAHDELTALGPQL